MKCSCLLVPSPLPLASPKSLFLPFFSPNVPFSNPPHFLHPQTLTTTPKALFKPFHFPLESSGNGSNNSNNNNNDGNNNSGGDPWWWRNSEDGFNDSSFGFILGLYFFHLQLASSAFARSVVDEEGLSVWEVKGSKWVKLIGDFVHDEFAVDRDADASELLQVSSVWKIIPSFWRKCRSIFMRLMLPEGYPQSVTSDYLDYSLWRGVQGVASQISGVLATQALLYAVGLGKGAIPTAAAINWVLKDGIGYLSKIMLSKYGRHFDVHPKGWRLFADFLENAAFGLEMSTPAFPHMFVFIGAVAGAARSAATLIQAATRSCFYAGFAAQRNFAEVIAKGEAQGMVSKFIGILLGIALANNIGSSTALSLTCFAGVTWIHMFCNLKSYQSIQLRTLNPYRASLVFSEYLLSGLPPPVNEVNDEEPLFPAIPFLHINSNIKKQSSVLSPEAKEAAAEIERRLQLGSKLSEIVESKDDAVALINLYMDEGYILAEQKGRYCVVLKENSLPQDMLKLLFQVNYLYWLERNAGITSRSTSADCTPGERLQLSLAYVRQEFNHVKNDSTLMGWTVDGLVARPLPNRVRIGDGTMASSASAGS